MRYSFCKERNTTKNSVLQNSGFCFSNHSVMLLSLFHSNGILLLTSWFKEQLLYCNTIEIAFHLFQFIPLIFRLPSTVQVMALVWTQGTFRAICISPLFTDSQIHLNKQNKDILGQPHLKRLHGLFFNRTCVVTMIRIRFGTNSDLFYSPLGSWSQ